jgi:hypothetical protein
MELDKKNIIGDDQKAELDKITVADFDPSNADIAKNLGVMLAATALFSLLVAMFIKRSSEDLIKMNQKNTNSQDKGIRMQISVVVPLYNEEESLPELMSWIDRVMREHSYSYEVIMVDDGSKDKSWTVIEQLSSVYPALRGIKFSRNYGKSAALNVGFGEAQGDVVITMDADLQDSPDEAPELYRMIVEDGYDLSIRVEAEALRPHH